VRLRRRPALSVAHGPRSAPDGPSSVVRSGVSWAVVERRKRGDGPWEKEIGQAMPKRYQASVPKRYLVFSIVHYRSNDGGSGRTTSLTKSQPPNPIVRQGVLLLPRRPSGGAAAIVGPPPRLRTHVQISNPKDDTRSRAEGKDVEKVIPVSGVAIDPVHGVQRSHGGGCTSAKIGGATGHNPNHGDHEQPPWPDDRDGNG
jgi:hypothetical protein